MAATCPVTGTSSTKGTGCPFSTSRPSVAPSWIKTAVVGGALAFVSLQLYRLWSNTNQNNESGSGKISKKELANYNHVMYRGVVYPSSMQPAAIDEMREKMVLRSSDVIIATYPKCGTTWMQQIVLLLLNNGDRTKVPDPMRQAPWLELKASFHYSNKSKLPGTCMADFNATEGTRVFKTHAPSQLVPWKHTHDAMGGVQAKVIVVCRNSLDAAVSMFHHSRDVDSFGYTGDWDDMFERFRTGQIEHGLYWDWYEGWYPLYQKYQQSILWINFEDLKKDLIGEVKKIADFLEVKCDQEFAKKVADGSTFSSMKKQFETLDVEKEKKGEFVKKNHIRKGKVGGWRAYFSEKQKEVFLERQKKYSSLVPTSVDINLMMN